MNEQYTFDEIGNIVPCPYKDECGAHEVGGCGGERGWCKPSKEGRPANKKEEDNGNDM